MLKINMIIITLITTINLTASGQDGAATPNELFSKAYDAYTNKNYEAFGNLFLVTEGDAKKEKEAFVNIIKLYPEVIKLKQDGLKKFGDEFKYEVLQNSNFDYAVNWKFDFEAAKNSKYKIQSMFGENLATTITKIAWENYEKPLYNSVTAIEKNGRWYMYMASKRVELYAALSKYLPQAKKLLNETKTAADFADKLKVYESYFDEFFQN